MSTRWTAALVVLLAVPAAATVVLKHDEAGMTRAADAVVVGEVLDGRSEWNAAGTFIQTVTRVRVDDTAKGTPARGAVVTVREVGGTIGDLNQRMVGAPEFAPRERVVLFLERAGDAFRTVGLSQGKLVVSRGPGGRAIATSAARDLGYAGARKAMWDDGPVDLEALLAEVRRHAGAP